MELLQKELSRRWYKYTVSYRENIYTFLLRDIYYLESSSHHLQIHLSGGEPVTFLGILDKEQEKLIKHGFLRIHKSYLINMEHIQCINSRSVTLDNQCSLPISRSMRPRIKEVYLRYAGEGGV